MSDKASVLLFLASVAVASVAGDTWQHLSRPRPAAFTTQLAGPCPVSPSLRAGATSTAGRCSQHAPLRERRSRSLSRLSMMARPARVQILISDTGGGHRSSAMALQDAFNSLYPGEIECDIIDIFVESGKWPYTLYPQIYQFLAKYPILWQIVFEFGANPIGIWINEIVMEINLGSDWKRCLERGGERADLVMSVHPLTQDLPLKLLAQMDGGSRKTPFCTVVTDLAGACPSWFDAKADTCYVPSDVLYQQAKRRGLSGTQLVQLGLPIRRGFWPGTSTASMSEMRLQLGLQAELPTVLVMGGGDGVGGLAGVARAVGEKLGVDGVAAGEQRQMVVVCGKNAAASAELSAIPWGEGVAVTVLGFSTNIHEWMEASDAIITKAGPGTIAEAAIKGLPCMLSAYLPGQEAPNVPFVCDAGWGDFSESPEVIAATVSEWLGNKEKMSKMKDAAIAASFPSATLDIADDIATKLFRSMGRTPAKARN